MKKQISTFTVHEKALTTVINALHSKSIMARVRRASPRSMTLRVCSTRQDCVKEALETSGYGQVTFDSNS